MATNSDVELEQALEGLTTGFKADGYVIHSHWPDASRVEIKISATEKACANCLVSEDVMRILVISMLREAGFTLAEDEVLLIYPESRAAR